jgi:hypothetical protein
MKVHSFHIFKRGGNRGYGGGDTMTQNNKAV